MKNTFATSVQSYSGGKCQEWSWRRKGVPFCCRESSTLGMESAQKDWSHWPVRWLSLSMPRLLEMWLSWDPCLAWWTTTGKSYQMWLLSSLLSITSWKGKFVEVGAWATESFGQGERTPGVFQPPCTLWWKQATGVGMWCIAIRSGSCSLTSNEW